MKRNTSSHKWRTVILLISFLIAALTVLNFSTFIPVNAVTQPVGTIAVKAIGVPAGTPTESQLNWMWNGFIKNATSSSPTCTVNLTQTLSADANKTVSADTITTALSEVYADDDSPYRVPALNETGNLNWIAEWTMNVTLGNHYIPQESYVKALSLTVKGNASISASSTTYANVYIYNFTAGAWVDLGTALNATSKATLTYTVPSGKESQFIDETHNNAVYLNFTWYDTSNTDYNVDIDYLALAVTYQFDISVGSWATTQTNSTVTVDEPGNYTVNYWENCTLSAPPGITGHNFTIYITPPDSTKLENHTVYVNNTATTVTVTSGQVAFDVTNLVVNSTCLNFNAKDMVKVSYPRVTSRIKTWEYADSLYSGLWAVEANVTNSFSELTAENVTLTLQDFTATPKLEVHRTAATWTMYLDGVETTPDSSTLGVSLTHNVTIDPLVKKNFTLVEKLPWAFVYNKTGGNIISSSYSEPMKLTFKIQAPTTQNVTVWCELTPYAVIFNGTEQPSNVWSYSHPFLKMKIPLSTKEVVVKTLAPWLIGPVSANHREIVSGTGTVDATVAADTKVIYNTTGAVMIDVARYEGNPGTAFRGDIGKYIDVHLNSSTSVNGIEVRLYYTDGQVPEAGNPKREEQLKMYYWDGTKWAVCSNTGVNTAENYIWTKITSTTTPSLSDLAGTPFAASSPEYPVGGTFGSVDRLFLLVKLAGQFITDQWPTIAGISMLVIGVFMLLYRRKK